MDVAKEPDRPARPQTPDLRFPMARTVAALILREMSTTYGRSPGGYVWAVLQPVGTILVLALGFSLLLRAPSLGTSFLMFYATGLLPLRMFQEVSANVGNSIAFNLALLGYPRVTLVDVVVARALLAILTQIMVCAIILTGIYLQQGIQESVDFGPVFLAFALSAFLGFGFGVFNAYAFFSFPIWKSLWGVATRPLMLVSGVFYTFEDLPRAIQDLLWFNPIVHVVGMSREGFYATYDPQYPMVSFVIFLALVPMFFGFLMLYRYGQSMLLK